MQKYRREFWEKDGEDGERLLSKTQRGETVTQAEKTGLVFSEDEGTARPIRVEGKRVILRNGEEW